MIPFLFFLCCIEISIKKSFHLRKDSTFAYSLESYQITFIILTSEKSQMREFATGIPYEQFLQNMQAYLAKMPNSPKESEILAVLRRNIQLRKEKQKAQEELEALMRVKSWLLRRKAGLQRREKRRRVRLQKIRQGATKRLAVFEKENLKVKSVEDTQREEKNAQRVQ